MSERLHVGQTDDPVYDCVLASMDGAKSKLVEWAMHFPLKVRIGDAALFSQAQPVLAEAMQECGRTWPDDVWFFYRGDEKLEHPTQAELDAWCATAGT